jgi:hypothetical protein
MSITFFGMLEEETVMAQDSDDRVWDHLEAIVETGQSPTDDDLYFDPVTGRLLVVERGTKQPADAVIADQTARDGFGAGSSVR